MPKGCQLTAMHLPPSLQDVRAKLPGPAHSLYYKDLIGNISSSNTVKTAKQVSAALFPKRAVHACRGTLVLQFGVDLSVSYCVLCGIVCTQIANSACQQAVHLLVSWSRTVRVSICCPA